MFCVIVVANNLAPREKREDLDKDGSGVMKVTLEGHETTIDVSMVSDTSQKIIRKN